MYAAEGEGGGFQKKSEVLVGIFAQILQFTRPHLAYQSWFTRAVVRVRSPQVSVRFSQIIPSISSRLISCTPDVNRWCVRRLCKLNCLCRRCCDRLIIVPFHRGMVTSTVAHKSVYRVTIKTKTFSCRERVVRAFAICSYN